jgi:hypothetical protein
MSIVHMYTAPFNFNRCSASEQILLTCTRYTNMYRTLLLREKRLANSDLKVNSEFQRRIIDLWDSCTLLPLSCGNFTLDDIAQVRVIQQQQ